MDESRSLAEMGAALYGGEPPPAHVPPTTSVARTFHEIAADLHDKPELPPEELPPEVRALREAEPGRLVYDDRTQYKAAGIDKALADLDIEGQAAEAEHRTWAGVFADLALNADDARHVVSLATMDEPTPEEAAAWPGAAKAALQGEYGPDGWEQALADARRLVGRDPRLKDFLNRTGLGDHPDVVRIAARQARAAIASGKLKRN